MLPLHSVRRGMSRIFPCEGSKNQYQWLAFWALIMCNVFVASAEEKNVRDSEHHIGERPSCGSNEPAKNNSMYVTASALILLSIVFEKVKEKIEELAEGSLRRVVQSLWGELTVLGFIALIAYLIAQTELLPALSEHIFSAEGSAAKEELPELVEEVHFALFAMMITYVALVFLLILVARRIERGYAELEDECSNPEKIIEMYTEARATGKNKRRVTRAMQYLVTRHQFINPAGVLPEKRLKSNFDFASYLSKRLSHFLSELVEINLLSWIFLFCVVTYFWLGAGFAGWVQLAMFLGFGWTLAGACYVILHKLNWVSERLTPPLPKYTSKGNKKNDDDEPARDVETAALLSRRQSRSYASTGKTIINEDNSGMLGGFHHPSNVSDMYDFVTHRHHKLANVFDTLGIGQPSFMKHKPRARTSLGRKILGPPPNAHESQFWMDRRGPHVHFQLTQFILIGLALYLAVMSTKGVLNIWSCSTTWWLATLLTIGMIVPSILVLYLTPNIVRLHGLVTNIEMMKHASTIVEVQREMKTRSSLIAIRMLQNISIRADKDKDNAGPRKKAVLSDKQVNYLRDVFFLFDKDKSGSISGDEVVGLFNALGMTHDEEEIKAALLELDSDGSGEVGFDEFLEYMSYRMAEPATEEESLKAMFKFFDKDNSGTVSAQEFYDTVQALGVGFTIDEIRAIISEVDESGDGQINMEEFGRMMKIHLAHGS